MPRKKTPVVIEDQFCKVCGKPVVEIPWNASTDIRYCNNGSCPQFHVPIKPDRPLAGKSSPKSRELWKRAGELAQELMSNHI